MYSVFTQLKTSVSILYSHFYNEHRSVDISVTMTILCLYNTMPIFVTMAYECRENKTKCSFRSIIIQYTCPLYVYKYLHIKNCPADFFINRFIPVYLLDTPTQNAFVDTTHSYAIIYILYIIYYIRVLHVCTRQNHYTDVQVNLLIRPYYIFSDSSSQTENPFYSSTLESINVLYIIIFILTFL